MFLITPVLFVFSKARKIKKYVKCEIPLLKRLVCILKLLTSLTKYIPEHTAGLTTYRPVHSPEKYASSATFLTSCQIFRTILDKLPFRCITKLWISLTTIKILNKDTNMNQQYILDNYTYSPETGIFRRTKSTKPIKSMYCKIKGRLHTTKSVIWIYMTGEKVPQVYSYDNDPLNWKWENLYTSEKFKSIPLTKSTSTITQTPDVNTLRNKCLNLLAYDATNGILAKASDHTPINTVKLIINNEQYTRAQIIWLMVRGELTDHIKFKNEDASDIRLSNLYKYTTK